MNRVNKFLLHIASDDPDVITELSKPSNSNKSPLQKLLWKTYPTIDLLETYNLRDVENDIASLSAVIAMASKYASLRNLFRTIIDDEFKEMTNTFSHYRKPKAFLLGESVLKVTTKTKNLYIVSRKDRTGRDFYVDISKGVSE